MVPTYETREATRTVCQSSTGHQDAHRDGAANANADRELHGAKAGV